MGSAQATLRVERRGSARIYKAQTVDAIEAALQAVKGEHDVSLEITRDGDGDRILVAVDESDAFVGLVTTDSVLELADERRAGGATRRFIIGGQPTTIHAEFCVALDDAMAVVRGWLAGSETPAIGRWVRR